jgi:hypothetical protein
MTVSHKGLPNLDNPRSQDLMKFFMAHTAELLRSQSPSYIELYRKYMPQMAEQAPALSESLLALAALQLGLQKNDKRLRTVDAATHYHHAVRLHYKALGDPDALKNDSLLATSLMLAQYEVRYMFCIILRHSSFC